MNNDARRRLEDVLDREILIARLLATTLAAERAALTGDMPEAVIEKAAQKVQLLETFETLETERRELCAAANLSLQDTTPAKSVGLAATIAERWRSLLELMAGCKTANEVNGYIINVRQGQIRQLMDIVRGATAPLTYGPQGKTASQAHRALARA
jgi:flagellar biosynthesis/type III secretory pathway chaperone